MTALRVGVPSVSFTRNHVERSCNRSSKSFRAHVAKFVTSLVTSLSRVQRIPQVHKWPDVCTVPGEVGTALQREAAGHESKPRPKPQPNPGNLNLPACSSKCRLSFSVVSILHHRERRAVFRRFVTLCLDRFEGTNSCCWRSGGSASAVSAHLIRIADVCSADPRTSNVFYFSFHGFVVSTDQGWM